MSEPVTIPEEAIEAAAQALYVDNWGPFVQPHHPWLTTFEAARQHENERRARLVLDAALPAILAAERERIAQAILAKTPAYEEVGSPEDVTYHDTLILAARIARGES